MVSRVGYYENWTTFLLSESITKAKSLTSIRRFSLTPLGLYRISLKPCSDELHNITMVVDWFMGRNKGLFAVWKRKKSTRSYAHLMDLYCILTAVKPNYPLILMKETVSPRTNRCWQLFRHRREETLFLRNRCDWWKIIGRNSENGFHEMRFIYLFQAMLGVAFGWLENQSMGIFQGKTWEASVALGGICQAFFHTPFDIQCSIAW